MPKAEVILWTRLKNGQLLGYKFRRQYSVGPYVIDLYCPELKLAREIDGVTHLQEEEQEYDRVRQDFIEGFKIRFLRVTNVEVYRDLSGVLRKIRETIKTIQDSLSNSQSDKRLCQSPP